MSSSATSCADFTTAAASGAKVLAHTTSVGMGTLAPRCCIKAMMAFASSTNSASAKDLPMGSPAASMKVLAIPPPTMSRSTFSASDFKIVSLVETFEPATMATKGRAGCLSALPSASSSAASKGPAHATGANFATPCVVASARCAVPKASLTYTSHSAAIFCASSSLFFFSPLLTRQFSSSTSSPGLTSTPSTQFDFSGTGRPSNSDKRFAIGASESSGLNSPSVGRPR